MRALYSGFALALGMALGLGTAAGSANAATCDGFTDVDSGAAYCTAVTYLKDHGITLGCTGTTYCPDAFVTRAQMALFLQRAGQANTSNVLGAFTTTIAGGIQNTATGGVSTVSGGASNSATALGASVGGGTNNTASGNWSAIAGGSDNTASGVLSFAAGAFANANADGCFVWGDDSTGNSVSCNAANRFVVRSLGGIFMFTGGTDQASYTGAVLASGGGAWINTSDRNGKEEFADVDPDVVLRKVVALPISTWKWKTQDASIRHMGPMAQDFSAAFGLGETPKGINTIDADGVALAAIQGLNAKLEAQVEALTERLEEKDAGMAALAHRLEEIESTLHH